MSLEKDDAEDAMADNNNGADIPPQLLFVHQVFSSSSLPQILDTHTDCRARRMSRRYTGTHRSLKLLSAQQVMASTSTRAATWASTCEQACNKLLWQCLRFSFVCCPYLFFFFLVFYLARMQQVSPRKDEDLEDKLEPHEHALEKLGQEYAPYLMVPARAQAEVG